ncbi:MAG: tyrosine-type recombinase/integrase [Pyrinomonadaceae bacterium]
MYTVKILRLNSGERLPALINELGIPVKVANRFILNYRRHHVQSSTLGNNLRDIGIAYLWADEVLGIDLDSFLLEGKVLNNRLITSLADYLRCRNLGSSPKFSSLSIFNNRLYTSKMFFVWSLDNNYRGGKSFFNFDELYTAESRISKAFNLHNIPGNHSISHKPLLEEEIKLIQKAISPILTNGKLIFPKNNFMPQTRLRNFLMFEFALNFGLRKGELLKVRLDCLPRGNNTELKVLRLPDDPSDTRRNEPNVKGAERFINIPQYLLSFIRVYLTTQSEEGRPSNKNPYLFLSRDGDPLSICSANDVIGRIGKISGVNDLCWHRLRHTWAERTADLLSDQNKNKEETSADLLQYLGGWRNPQSAKTYIQNSIRRQANEALINYQSNLYEEN